MEESEFAVLEGKAREPAEELLAGFLTALGEFDTETLRAIADYREAIQPSGWMQNCIREYLDVWR